MITALIFTLSFAAHGSPPDWSRGASLPEDGRSNPYQISVEEWSSVIRAGRLHALHYPVSVTAIQLPYYPIARFLAADSKDPLKFFVQSIVSGISDIRSLEDLEKWLGLKPYPETEGSGPYQIPFLNGKRPEHRMGLTLLETPRGLGFTISCAQCHSDTLFGRAVLGMSNRFPRANEMFVRALQVVPKVSTADFKWSTDATDGEAAMYSDVQKALRRVSARKPVQLGLDTSLAQVSLSLAKQLGHAPHPNAGDVADSKPAVWWNVKFKNRWLLDGSVVSGNPILTNFIWNEIGRGTKLDILSRWIRENPKTIEELTTAVFAAEAPLFTDFFPASAISEPKARHGEGVFNQRCAGCHGHYEKAWNDPAYSSRPWADRLRTLKVRYPQPTRVINVGTDPLRHRGMRALLELNDLNISKENGIVIERQYGYVAPPLVGIWARWPYFHNNSVPSLCALLTRSAARPKEYWARPANDPHKDFDSRCNGYPSSAPPWDTAAEFLYDTALEGRSAAGHDEGIFLKDGREILSIEDKWALIHFLQTL